MEQLKELQNEKDILTQEVVVQLQKDLRLSGLEPDLLNDQMSLDELVNQLRAIVTEMISYRPGDFDRFMYRIDVPEKQLKGVLHRDLDKLVDHLSLLILKREMQKIVFRKQFGA